MRVFFDAQPGSAIKAPVLLQRAESVSLLREIIPRLLPIDQEVIQKFYFNGQSLIEISEELHCPVGTIKRRLHTARARMGDKIREQIPDFDLSDE